MTQGVRKLVTTPEIIKFEFQNGVWSKTTDTGKFRINENVQRGEAGFVPFGPLGLIVIVRGESPQPENYIPGVDGGP